MLQMLWTLFWISTTSSRLLQHCHGLVVVLLWNDFHIKLKLSHNKDTTFTTSSQQPGLNLHFSIISKNTYQKTPQKFGKKRKICCSF